MRWMIFSVKRWLLPGAVCTETNSMPVSSLGTRPLLVLRINSPAPTIATTRKPAASQLRRSMKRSPDAYLRDRAV